MVIGRVDAERHIPRLYLALRFLDLTAPLLGELEDITDLEALLVEAYTYIMAEQRGNGQKLLLLAYTDSSVVWGTYAPGELATAGAIDPAFLQELRLFGPSGEYYLWRHGTGFHARTRVDVAPPATFGRVEQEGYVPPFEWGASEPNVADEWQALWGTRIDQDGPERWTVLFEERGARLLLPPLGVEEVALPELPLRLLVRHYLTYDGQSGICAYSDLRCVALCDARLRPLVFTS